MKCIGILHFENSLLFYSSSVVYLKMQKRTEFKNGMQQKQQKITFSNFMLQTGFPIRELRLILKAVT